MIIVVFGLPGTGKSYYAEHLAEYLNAGYVSTDEIRNQNDVMSKYDKKTRKLVFDHTCSLHHSGS